MTFLTSVKKHFGLTSITNLSTHPHAHDFRHSVTGRSRGHWRDDKEKVMCSAVFTPTLSPSQWVSSHWTHPHHPEREIWYTISLKHLPRVWKGNRKGKISCKLVQLKVSATWLNANVMTERLTDKCSSAWWSYFINQMTKGIDAFSTFPSQVLNSGPRDPLSYRV